MKEKILKISARTTMYPHQFFLNIFKIQRLCGILFCLFHFFFALIFFLKLIIADFSALWKQSKVLMLLTELKFGLLVIRLFFGEMSVGAI